MAKILPRNKNDNVHLLVRSPYALTQNLKSAFWSFFEFQFKPGLSQLNFKQPAPDVHDQCESFVKLIR